MKCFVLCVVLAVSALAADSEVKECKTTDRGKEYIGVKAETGTGKACQFWSENTPNKHSFHKSGNFPEEDPKNYCRNPDGASGGPWCFIADGSKRWAICDIPRCPQEAAGCDCDAELAALKADLGGQLSALSGRVESLETELEEVKATAEFAVSAAAAAQETADTAKETADAANEAAAKAAADAEAAVKAAADAAKKAEDALAEAEAAKEAAADAKEEAKAATEAAAASAAAAEAAAAAAAKSEAAAAASSELAAMAAKGIFPCEPQALASSSFSGLETKQFSASSTHGDCALDKAMLNSTVAWCSAGHTDPDEYLQVDLLVARPVVGTATQGRNDGQWVTKIKILYSIDGSDFVCVKTLEEDACAEFEANADADSVVYQQFCHPVEARYIRFVPLEWNSHKSMRVEVMSDMSGFAVCEGEALPNSAYPAAELVTASFSASSFHSDCPLHYAPLDSARAWCASTSTNPKDYLQVDLGVARAVAGTATQGRVANTQWVTAVKILYSSDGSEFVCVKTRIGTCAEFDGNTNSNTVYQKFCHPVQARYIRFVPLGYSGHKSMRVGVLAEAVGRCPQSHPYAYQHGDYCCYSSKEKSASQSDCEGRTITTDSMCCDKDAYLACPSPPCLNSNKGKPCPSHHPYAYYNGQYCCASSMEKSGYTSPTCSGTTISLTSLCCKGDAHVRCPNSSCFNA